MSLNVYNYTLYTWLDTLAGQPTYNLTTCSHKYSGKLYYKVA